jgi:hypothetical protein
MRIAGKKVRLGTQTAAFVERRMRFALTRFAPMIDDVVVTLGDEAGPRGAPAKSCRVAVRLQRKGSIVVDSTDASFETAASRAADRAGRSVARQINRKRQVKQYHRRRYSNDIVQAQKKSKNSVNGLA